MRDCAQLIHNRHIAMPQGSEAELQSELKLARVKSRRWLTESRQRANTRAKGVVRDAEVCSVEKVEAFGQHVKAKPFVDPEVATQPHVERRKVETSPSIAPYAHWSIVIRVGVAITAE